MSLARTSLALALATLAAGCSGAADPAPPPEEGGLSFALTIHPVLGIGTPIPVGAVWVHLRGTTSKGNVVDQWSQAQGTAGRYTLTLSKVAIGSYLVGGAAFSNALALPTSVADFATIADVPVQVLAKAQAPVALTLQQNVVLHPPGQTADRAPTVDSLVVSSHLVDSADPTSAVSVAATASDPDGPADLVSFAWTASYSPPLAAGSAPGGFAAPASLATSWAPPPSYVGTVTVAFAATDKSGASSALALAVKVSPANGFGSVGFTVSVNNYPDLGPIRTSAAQPRPSQVVPLSVLARDPDGDPLTIAWDDGGCGGLFTPQLASTTTSWIAPAVPGPCTLRVSVADGRGGTNASTLLVQVSDVPGSFGPEIVFASQSPGNPAPGNGPVWFRVEAQEPTADPALQRPVTALSWMADLGGVFDPVVVGDPAWVRWTPPPCAAPGLRAASVTVIATGSSSDPLGNPNRTAFTFPVQLACP